MTTQIEVINQEISTELSNEKVQKALLATTFKGLDLTKMRQALLEGRMRGFEFKDFLEKNVYAVPFSGGYSLVTSIDYARKIGMRSGVVGKSAPTFTEKDGKVVSCTVTVKRKVQEYVGEYTATVYFDEYSTGRNLWANKPRTMIAKVAEMHALRMACPEELAKAYVEEEMEREDKNINLLDDDYKNKIDAINDLEELKTYYLANKGKGKDFDKYVSKRKKELQEKASTKKKNENS